MDEPEPAAAPCVCVCWGGTPGAVSPVEVVQREGAEQQRPPPLSPRIPAEQQQRQQEGRNLLQEPAQSGRAAATLRRRVAAVLRMAPGLVPQVDPTPDDQDPAEDRNSLLPALHLSAAARFRSETEELQRGGVLSGEGEQSPAELFWFLVLIHVVLSKNTLKFM